MDKPFALRQKLLNTVALDVAFKLLIRRKAEMFADTLCVWTNEKARNLTGDIKNLIIIVITTVCLFVSGGRIFHTATRLKNNSILIYGGRTSPTKPCVETLQLSLATNTETNYSHSTNDFSHYHSETECKSNEDFQSSRIVKESYKHTVLNCQGEIPEPRWRHSTTHVILPDGTTKSFLFFAN